MMSARRASSPGTLARAAAVRCLTSSGDHVVEGVGGELEAVVRAQRLGAGRGVHDARHRLGRSRRGDGDLEAERADVPVEVLDEAADVVAAVLDGVLGDVAAREEAVGQAHGADLEAARGQRLAAFADEQLRRSAADVDEQQPPVEHRHRLQDTEMDQPRLLDPGDHLDAHARFRRRPLDELAGVGRLADRARRDGAGDRVEPVGDALHPRQAGQPALQRVGREQLHVPAAGAEADHLPLGRQRLEAVAVDRAGDDEVDAVGADVDRRERWRSAVGRPRRPIPGRRRSGSRAIGPAYISPGCRRGTSAGR